jgi:hypothetical protein
MKNVSNTQLKKCILVSNREFDRIIAKITENKVIVEYSIDGICYEGNYEEDTPQDRVDEIDEYTEENFYQDITRFYKKLAEYFDVNEITSIHTDDCESPIGVWICYKD